MTSTDRLKLAERRLEILQRLGHIGVWEYDPGTGDVWCSAETHRIFGVDLPVGPLSLEAFLERVHPADREPLRDCILRQHSHPSAYRVLLQDGTIRHIHEEMEYERDAEGRVLRVRGVLQDITERVKEQLILRESEEKFNKAFHANSMAMSLCTLPEERFLDANAEFLGMAGRTRGEVLGRTAAELGIWINPAQREAVMKIIEKEGIARNIKLESGTRAGKVLTLVSTAVRIVVNRQPCLLVSAYDVTSLKESDRALRESESRYKALVEASPDAIVLYDPKGDFITVNRQAALLYGVADSEAFMAEVRNVGELLPGHERGRAFDNIAKTLSEGRSGRNEYHIRLRDGSLLPVEINSAVLRVGDGEPQACISVVRDVSERRAAEENLRISEGRYRELVQNANSIILRMDLEGNVTFFNEFAQQFFGYAGAEILGRNVVGTIVPPASEDGRDLRAMILDIGRNTAAYANNENENLKRNGDRVWIAWSNRPIQNARGEVVEILCVGNDITERKRMEGALQKSEERYRTLIENQGEGVAVVDSRERIVFANPAAERIFGVPPGCLVDRNLAEFLDSDQMNLIAHETQKRIHGEKSVYELEIKRPDGERRFLLVTGTPQYDKAGSFICTFGVFRDITERRRTEDAIRLQRDLSIALGSCESLKQALDIVLDGYCSVEGIDCGGIYLVDPGTGAVDLAAHRGLSPTFVEAVSHFDADAPSVQILKEGQSLYLPLDSIPGDLRPLMEREGKRRLAVIPVMCQGRAVAGINLCSRHQDEFPLHTRYILEALAAYVGGVLVRLRAEEERRLLESAVRHANDAIIVATADREGPPTILYVNPAFTTLLGYAPEEVVGGGVEVLDRSLSSGAVMRQLARLLAKGDSSITEWSIRRKDGSSLDLEVHLTPIAAAGAVTRFVAVLRDITQRKRAEEQLRASQALFNTAMDAMHDWIHVVDLDLRILYINNPFIDAMRQMGFPGDPVGKTLPEVFPFISDDIFDQYRQVAATGRSMGTEERTVVGENIYFTHTQKFPVLESGAVVRIVTCIRDITERHHALESLRESEDRYRGTFEQAAVGITHVSLEGMFLRVNPRFCELVGYPEEELLHMRFQGITHSDDLADDLSIMQKLLDGDVRSYALEKRYIRKDGTTVRAGITVTLRRRPSGEPHYFISIVEDIRARKSAEQNLEEERRKLNDIIEFLPDAAVVLDRERKVIAWNRAMEDMTGIKKEAMLGKAGTLSGLPFYGEARLIFMDYVIQGNVEEATNYHSVTRRGSTTFAETFAPMLRDGRGAHLWLAASPLMNPEGECIGAIETIRDLTDRKRIEEDLLRLKKAVETSQLGITISDPEGRILYTNPAEAVMHGYSVEELVGMSSRVLSTRDRWRDMDIREKRSFSRQSENRRKDGTVFPVQLTSNIVMDVEGIPIGVVTVCEDITERMRTDEKLRRMETAIEHSAEAIVITDAEARIEYVNPAFAKVSGYSREEIVGRNPRILKSGLHEAPFYRGLWDTLNRGSAWKGHLIDRSKGGALYEVDATISPIINDAGETTGYVGMKRDVTEERRQQKRFQERERMASIGELAGAIAHEIKNPLFAITGGLQVLEMELSLNPEQQSYLKTVIGEGLRIDRLIRKLRAYSHPIQLERRPTALGDILASAVLAIRGLAKQREVRTVLEPIPNAPLVAVDPDKMTQVIFNLLQNALEASQPGGTIRASMAVTGAHVELSVCDDGSGIPAKIMDRIFDPLFTTKTGNTGLGLYIVRSIIVEHGGDIDMVSDPERGTRATIRLPLEGFHG